MTLFERPLNTITKQIESLRKTALLKTWTPASHPPWPRGKSIVLMDNTALELGHPEKGSLSLLLFSEKTGATNDSEKTGATNDEILLHGLDACDITTRTCAFCQVIIARCDIDNPYECFLSLEDKLFNTALEGMMIRSLPSQQNFWCRLSYAAKTRDFSLYHWGQALVEEIKSLPFVRSVTVFFSTSPDLIQLFTPASIEVKRIVGALVKRYQEPISECSTCEYSDICEEKNHV